MPFTESLKQQLEELLAAYDVAGARGCQLFPRRTSVLAHVDARSFTETETDLDVQFYQMSQEGFGPACFWKDHFCIPVDTKLNESLTLLWDVKTAPPMPSQNVWFCNVRDLESWPQDFVFDDQSFCIRAKQQKQTHATLHHLELFAGGLEVGPWQPEGFTNSLACHIKV